jgi:hypothetical protein
MGRKSRITVEKILGCVLRCINGEKSVNHTTKLVGVEPFHSVFFYVALLSLGDSSASNIPPRMSIAPIVY